MDLALHEPTCRVRRHAHVQHVLTADETSLAELQAALAVMPICATGRVFVEVPDASWIGVLDAPARMSVAWLDRAARPGDSRPGDALARAVAAWADEMLCAGGDETRVVLLHGGAERIARHLTDAVGLSPESIRRIG